MYRDCHSVLWKQIDYIFPIRSRVRAFPNACRKVTKISREYAIFSTKVCYCYGNSLLFSNSYKTNSRLSYSISNFLQRWSLWHTYCCSSSFWQQSMAPWMMNLAWTTRGTRTTLHTNTKCEVSSTNVQYSTWTGLNFWFPSWSSAFAMRN